MPQMFARMVAILRKWPLIRFDFPEGLTLEAIPICDLVAGKVAN
jgi:hypothetical protein